MLKWLETSTGKITIGVVLIMLTVVWLIIPPDTHVIITVGLPIVFAANGVFNLVTGLRMRDKPQVS
ncbi:MAG TPA: hypothetical protein VK053_23530 [Jiangellaceae bacterium]|nr:hypothetical protein [Jiangellaceae bacterium]